MSDYIIVHGIKVAQNYVPETFGRLTTVGPRFRIRRGDKYLQVSECTCGSHVIVRTSDLTAGKIKSCGCYRAQRASIQQTTHGRSQTPEFRAWQELRRRCFSTNRACYPNYRGRGIRVCDRWLEPETGFLNFLADMGERPSKGHSIDRKENDGDYCPENCRWATIKEQSRNKRSNRQLTAFGKTKCVADWAEEFGISYGALMARIRRGIGTEEALTKTMRKWNAQP